MGQASELFMDLVCNGGTPSADCGLCGRTHFAAGENSCESEREIERLRRLAEEQPDKYCETGEDSLSIGAIAGSQVVWNCPCNKLRQYEDFIWDERELIVAYIKARTAQELKSANSMAEQLGSL